MVYSEKLYIYSPSATASMLLESAGVIANTLTLSKKVLSSSLLLG